MTVYVCTTGNDDYDDEVEAVFASEADAEEWVRLKNAAESYGRYEVVAMDVRATLDPAERADLEAKIAARKNAERLRNEERNRLKREADARERSANEWQTMAFDIGEMRRLIKPDMIARDIDAQSWLMRVPARYRAEALTIARRVVDRCVGRPLSNVSVAMFVSDLYAAIRAEVKPTPMPDKPEPVELVSDPNVPHGTVIAMPYPPWPDV